MTDLKTLEKRIDDLEKRLEKVEYDKEWMEELYKKAKELVIKHNKSSVIFLQRKLMIDYERAKRLLEDLKAGGVV
jgi:DNA segregation ATPase FtsK/SpoIIIE-like protein